MNNSKRLFDILGVEPNEVFEITGQPFGVEYRITDMLNIEWRENSERWRPSGVELRWFILGRYSNGTPLSIIKKHKTTLKCCPHKHRCCCECQ